MRSLKKKGSTGSTKGLKGFFNLIGSNSVIVTVILCTVVIIVSLFLFFNARQHEVIVSLTPPPSSSSPFPSSSSSISAPTFSQWQQQMIKPDIYPEPVTRLGYGHLPALRDRVMNIGPIQQIGILTGEGGSSSSAAPDRTILPLFGRELDSRRSKWNYYTRTDGVNPVQVPVRVGNRSCDDDRNGCNEVFSDDSVHVPALGRSFKATIYNKTIF